MLLDWPTVNDFVGKATTVAAIGIVAACMVRRAIRECKGAPLEPSRPAEDEKSAPASTKNPVPS
jgi:hypothetical protein